ncbi:hypothetical protein FACS189459_2870 [Bacilli bacterium]|nr:hypothetical protein FACS189459_2870 [Bacilli bacterium]GHU51726.1 hypothetical protein FACS189496_0560 [Bacilli bacterium]
MIAKTAFLIFAPNIRAHIYCKICKQYKVFPIFICDHKGDVFLQKTFPKYLNNYKKMIFYI